MSEAIAIQATIVGFVGEPATVFSGYDKDTKQLVVSKITAYRKDRFRTCLVITNNKDLDNESLFKLEDFNEAIHAFYALLRGRSEDGKGPRIVIDPTANPSDPSNSIEHDGYDSTGPRYRVSPDLSNAQAAVLATCLYAFHADAIDDVVRMADAFKDFASGGIIHV